jgi:urease gamma subunit
MNDKTAKVRKNRGMGQNARKISSEITEAIFEKSRHGVKNFMFKFDNHYSIGKLKDVSCLSLYVGR